MLLVDPATAVK